MNRTLALALIIVFMGCAGPHDDSAPTQTIALATSTIRPAPQPTATQSKLRLPLRQAQTYAGCIRALVSLASPI